LIQPLKKDLDNTDSSVIVFHQDLEKMPHRIKSNPLAILPLVVFLCIFVGSGAYFSYHNVPYAFYQISPTIAILPAIAIALFLAKGPFTQRMEGFLEGVRDTNIIMMCLIFLLAGAFSEVTKSIGGTHATVNLGLSLLPPGFLLPGLFLIATFMATAMGTSMGVIATVGPLAFGIAGEVGLSLPWCMGAVVSGAMFGDNLSIVSDTTIASVNTQGADPRKKFILNCAFAIPAMLVTTFLLYCLSTPTKPFIHETFEWIKILPYLLILVLALAGMNVLVVLITGIVSAGIVGMLITQGYSFVVFSKNMVMGFASMQEIFILSLMIGGLSYLTNEEGGLEFLIHWIESLALKIRKKVISHRIGELSISAIASIADICTANNTVAIVLCGNIAKKLSNKHDVSPERSACLLDIFSCVFQGILPYSAQLLLASSISGLSPLELMTKVIYCPILGAFALLFIFLQWPQTKRS
jgi:Na+/H+ antiporter NhaC